MAAVITMAPTLNIAADTCKAGRRPQASITSMAVVRLLGIYMKEYRSYRDLLTRPSENRSKETSSGK